MLIVKQVSVCRKQVQFSTCCFRFVIVCLRLSARHLQCQVIRRVEVTGHIRADLSPFLVFCVFNANKKIKTKDTTKQNS